MGLWGAWLWWRRRLDASALFQRAATLMAPAGFVAVLAGWIAAEAGRQPWVVQGVLRTSQAVSPLAGGQVGSSLLAFMIIYGIVFSAGVLYILRTVSRGPGGGEQPPERGRQAAGNPLAGVGDASATKGGTP
jgi:cytochrome d ubiquinol oxidase subunit I